MTNERKSELILNAGRALKEQGFRVFVHYADWIEKLNGKRFAEWLKVTSDGRTTAGVFIDMFHYTVSSSHHPCKEAGTGLGVLDWGDGIIDPNELHPYVTEALTYPHPPAPRWVSTKNIRPMSLDDTMKEYAKMNWSLEEL